MALSGVRLPEGWVPAADTLNGRVVMITGATGGLGRETALACARAGASVVLVGRRVRELEKLYDALLEAGHAKPAVVPLNLESATPAQYAELAGMIEAEFGHLDGLLHAAAHFDGLTPISQHRPDQWLRTLQVNLSAPFALTQAMQPLLAQREDAAVVFVLDDPERMRQAHWGAYGVAKAGLESMVAILHQETESTPVRVHALLPAPMRTELRRMAWFGEDTMAQPTPEATAQAAVYLLSAQATAARGAMLDLR
ncbi:SDR family NAD(P)-dependent oxidoreductase [Oleiagrimonas sp. C23AA]|uniref:SDR family NAD(P)-dependent oxidoreductase n=1 Tax=Oleiagrimonas sp. C23AA TaxID=2719047 RepID=UPI001423B2CB|nr:SDR family NAD(P)-dependent oxidoreductase [Oleiagrimonas sp. C23AA]NII11481.1 SDR family NAD(P)-dependent oxidoreductase [Oleiagrimonas sp. C23AA]